MSRKIIKDHLSPTKSAAIQSIALHKKPLRSCKFLGEIPVKTEILKFDEKMMGPLPDLSTDYLTLIVESVKI